MQIPHGENPKGPLSLCWSKPWSLKMCASPSPVEGRPAINRGTSASKWGKDVFSGCNVRVRPASKCSYDVNYKNISSKSGRKWGAFPESVMAQGRMVRSCLHYQSAVSVFAHSQGGWISMMALEQDSSQTLIFWQQLVSQVKL